VVIIVVCFADELCKLITWDDESLNDHLPLPAQSSVDVSLSVFGLSDFVSTDRPPYLTCTSQVFLCLAYVFCVYCVLIVFFLLIVYSVCSFSTLMLLVGSFDL